MKKYKNFEVVLSTAWGNFLISDAYLELPENNYCDIVKDDDHNTRPNICNSIILEWRKDNYLGWRKEPKDKMCLGYAVWGDVCRFIKWNEEHDERHQINIESLQLHQVVLTPHAHKVQLMWIFTDPVGTERTLRGLLNTPRKLAVSGEIMATWPDDEFTVYF